ncbi:hypothetical protein EP47_08860 [Legionella norrlandica]|uniref:Uncharacterized protein n=2 Tax=Legionella norrlandica TaxID=1498499 RepID=A0A0A2SN75_9GAMM|nr:hypothetical protein EP47_08860 [Legionella norrlandica]
MTSDSLHNQNCYRYLKKLSLTPYIMEVFSKSLAESLKTVQSHSKYDENFPYANVYKKFFTGVEGNIKEIYDKRRNELETELKEDSLSQVRWKQFDDQEYEKKFEEYGARCSNVHIRGCLTLMKSAKK